MKLHFAGAESQLYNDLLKEEGVLNTLESYYSLRGKKPRANDLNLLLDSGGFVARTRNIKIDVKEYANFINKYRIKLAFNLDTNDIKETFKNQEYLEEHTEAYIIPVFHYEYLNLNILDEWIEKYEYISVGGFVNSPLSNNQKIYMGDHIFSRTRDKVKVHGLGITNMRLLKKYPWYSVDSTTWLSFSIYGRSYKKTVKESKIRAKFRNYIENTRGEIRSYLELEKKITRLWKTKGVTWDN